MAEATCEVCGYDGSLSWLIRCKNSHRCGQGRHIYCLDGFEVPQEPPEDLAALTLLECSLCAQPTTQNREELRKKSTTAAAGQPRKPTPQDGSSASAEEGHLMPIARGHSAPKAVDSNMTFGHAGTAFAHLDAQQGVIFGEGTLADDDTHSMDATAGQDTCAQPGAVQIGNNGLDNDYRPQKRARNDAVRAFTPVLLNQNAGKGVEPNQQATVQPASTGIIGNGQDYGKPQSLQVLSGSGHAAGAHAGAGSLVKQFKGQLKVEGRHAQFLEHPPAARWRHGARGATVSKSTAVANTLDECTVFDDLSMKPPLEAPSRPSAFISKPAVKVVGASGIARLSGHSKKGTMLSGASETQVISGKGPGEIASHDPHHEQKGLAGPSTGPSGNVGALPHSRVPGQQPNHGLSAPTPARPPLGPSSSAGHMPPGGRGRGPGLPGRGTGRTLLGAVPAGRTGQPQGVQRQSASFNIMQAIGKGVGISQGVSAGGLGGTGALLSGQGSGSHQDSLLVPLPSIPSVGPSQPSLEPATMLYVLDRRVPLWNGILPLLESNELLPQRKSLSLTMKSTNPHDSMVQVSQLLPTSEKVDTVGLVWKLIPVLEVPSTILETRQFYQENMPCETCLVMYLRYSIGAADHDFKQWLSKLREISGSMMLALELSSITQDQLKRGSLSERLLASPNSGGKPAPCRLYFVPHQVPINGFDIDKGVEDCLLCLTGSRQHIHLMSSWDPVPAHKKGVKGILKGSCKVAAESKLKVQFRHLDEGTHEQGSTKQVKRECEEEKAKDVRSHLAHKSKQDDKEEDGEAEVDELPEQLTQTVGIPDVLVPAEDSNRQQEVDNVEQPSIEIQVLPSLPSLNSEEATGCSSKQFQAQPASFGLAPTEDTAQLDNGQVYSIPAGPPADANVVHTVAVASPCLDGEVDATHIQQMRMASTLELNGAIARCSSKVECSNPTMFVSSFDQASRGGNMDLEDLAMADSHDITSGIGDGNTPDANETEDGTNGDAAWFNHLLDWRQLVPCTPSSELGRQAGPSGCEISPVVEHKSSQLWSWRDLLPLFGSPMQQPSSNTHPGILEERIASDGPNSTAEAVQSKCFGAATCWSWSKVSVPVLQAATLEKMGTSSCGLRSQLPQLWQNLKALPHMPLHSCHVRLVATDDEFQELQSGIMEAADNLCFSWSRGCTKDAPEDLTGIRVLALSHSVIKKMSDLTGLVIKSIAVHPIQVYRATTLIHGLQLLSEELKKSNEVRRLKEQPGYEVTPTLAQALHLAHSVGGASKGDCQPLYPESVTVLLDAQGFLETPALVLKHLTCCLAAGSRVWCEPWLLQMRDADIATVQKCGSPEHKAVLMTALKDGAGFGCQSTSGTDMQSNLEQQPLLKPLDVDAQSEAKELKVLRDAVRLMHVQRPGRIVIAAYSGAQALEYTSKGRKCKNILAGAVTEVVAFLDLLLLESWEQELGPRVWTHPQ